MVSKQDKLLGLMVVLIIYIYNTYKQRKRLGGCRLTIKGRPYRSQNIHQMCLAKAIPTPITYTLVQKYRTKPSQISFPDDSASFMHTYYRTSKNLPKALNIASHVMKKTCHVSYIETRVITLELETNKSAYQTALT